MWCTSWVVYATHCVPLVPHTFLHLYVEIHRPQGIKIAGIIKIKNLQFANVHVRLNSSAIVNSCPVFARKF